MSVFETERLNGSDDVYAIHSIPLGRDTHRNRRNNAVLLVGFGVLSCVSLVLALVAIIETAHLRKEVVSRSQPTSHADPLPATIQFQPTRRIAFGSCSSYDLRPQPLWVDGVIPAKPDAWIWVGDMAYLDTNPVSCSIPSIAAAMPSMCNCNSTYLTLPGQCLAGDVDAARERWTHAVQDPGYRTFLDYMCPPQHGAAVASASGLGGFGAEPGRFPPTGTDPAVCPRPIFGVYDDHDYGWNNGNRRLPNKGEYKRMFLDAVGEAPASTRRRADVGLQAAYTLNGGAPGRDIDVVLLDERWYRDTLPCSMRANWCTGVVLPNSAHPLRGWCRDFLLDDGTTGRGSCCTKDDDLALWCALPSSRGSPLWRTACDPTSRDWAQLPVVLGPDNATLLVVDDALWNKDQESLWPRLLQARDSPVCEVLGSGQRSWLADHLASSKAALTIVASGSVPLGSMGWVGPEGSCSADDWNCWPPAQLNFLHTLANISSGCVVVLTGDYHFGDIKVAAPGGGAKYSAALQTSKLGKHVYQVMASGMTDSTAHDDGRPCNGSYREDLVGLRPLGNCGFTSHPNFGVVEVDWEARVVHLTIRDADGGGIAKTQGGKQQHVAFSLKSCAPVAV